MQVLVACEFSGVVRDAFIAAGHDALSCDLLLTDSIGGPHYQGDVRDILYDNWDLVIAHPPCDHLSVSGARWFKEKRKDGRQQAAIEFFMMFTKLQCRWAIENPVGIMSTLYRKPDQIIQPWQFGHPESKATCLWLHKLPKLQPINILTKTTKYWNNQTKSGQNKLPPSSNRAKLRSKTYHGIAEAMAITWGKELQR
jgi:site-specific DNA-cytosine methylase